MKKREVKLSTTIRDYLKDRGICEHAADARGLYGLTSAQAKVKFGWSCPALAIPYHGTDGNPLLNSGTPFVRARLFPEAKSRFGGRAYPKFIQRAGTANHLYLDPSRTNWSEVFQDASVKLIITEGEVKAMCATEHDLTCVAIGGVWSWRTRVDGDNSVPLTELDGIVWRDRQVELAFDSDAADKPAVQAALVALAEELTRRGAKVWWVRLPTANGAKTGLDDFLVAHGRREYDTLEREEVRLILSPSDPLHAARTFLATHHLHDDINTLYHWRGGWYAWTGTHYTEQESGRLRKLSYEFLGKAQQRSPDGGALSPYKPNKKRVDDMLDALEAVTHRDRQEDALLWLDERESPPPKELLACRNGLLHVPKRELHLHTPAFFTTSGVPFDYDPKATAPAWEGFLNQLWSNDPTAVQTLQEMFGYLLTQDTSQQKIFIIVGPKRSGKGTIARVLTGLVGANNVCAPTLASLSAHFGLSPLIDKQAAVISDARLSGRADQQVITERLLSISGEDAITVDRKYREAWTGRMAARFLILTNELPKLLDVSGALPSRFIMLTLRESFYGREDLGLTNNLLAELPGILSWALDGLKRLQKRGHFVPPKSSQDALQELEDLASPVKAFVRDCCKEGVNLKIACEDLFQAWRRWSEVRGRNWTGTHESFGRDLRAVLPSASRKQLRVKGRVVWHYTGIALQEGVTVERRKW